MIYLKSNEEIALLREAGRVVAQTHQELKKHIKPGISTYELDMIAEEFIRSKGCTPSFKGYGGFPGPGYFLKWTRLESKNPGGP